MLDLIDLYLGRLPPIVQERRAAKDVVFCDIETYHNLFYVAFKRRSDGKRLGYELSHRSKLDREAVRRILKRYTVVTFNGATYDVPIILLALTGADNAELKAASDRIIMGGMKWWDSERELGITIPKWLDHIDLFEPNPSVGDGLKTLNGRLHGERLQDLPYPSETILTDEQMDDVIDYCLMSDLDATENLHEALKEALELRVALGERYGMDLRSKSDAQVGETIIKKRIEQLTGKKPQKNPPKPGTAFKYEVPEWMSFETEQMQSVLDIVRDTTFILRDDGKVLFPKAFEALQITIGGSTYKMGIGGLHSTESNRAVHSDDDYVLIDADVASQYPNIIMKLGLYPKALGKDFLRVYQAIIDERLAAKRRSKQIDEELKTAGPNHAPVLKAEKAAMTVRDKGGKIQLNGVYGKLGSRFSILYAPHLLIAVTLTGQLSLLMLIERAEAAGISVISGNTDGVVFRCPRNLFDGFVMKDGKPTDRLAPSPLTEIIDWWEGKTGFKLEFAEYRSIYNRDVNYYVAIKPNGKGKRKGSIANHWHPDSPDYDPAREQMKKNPKMTIVGDAVLAFLRDGTPIEKTIRECQDVRGFLTVIKATGGATWRDGYLGKVVRYYWSTDGESMIKVKPHPKTGNRPKVPETEGCRPLMTLPKVLPADIDYARYIETAESILDDIGYYDAQVCVSPMEALLRRLQFNNQLNILTAS